MLEQPLAARPQRHHDQTSVLMSTAPAHIAVLFLPVNQFHSAVLFQRDAFRKYPDRRLVAT